MDEAQAELPLEIDAKANSKATHQTVRDALKALDRARRSIAQTAKSIEETAQVSIPTLDKVIAPLRPIGRLLSVLDGHREALTRIRDKALARRREELHRSAKGANWSTKRLRDYDFVGCFQVDYQHERVTLRIGSEIYSTFDEADGARLFSRLQNAKRTLDAFPFVRSEFFGTIKGASYLARLQQKDRDGKVPIRILYPLMVLVRQILDNNFVKRPVPKSFTEYPMAQFVYDLARFGRESWAVRDERLRSQGPNMTSIMRGDTVTLPSLDGDGSDGEQIGLIWIQRG